MLEFFLIAMAGVLVGVTAAVLLRRTPPRGPDPSLAAVLESLARQREQAEALNTKVEATSQALSEMRQGEEARRAQVDQKFQDARQALERLEAEGKARAQRAEKAFGGLERLETIIAGTKSRGTAGENLLAEVIKQLPPEFRAYDVRIGGKTVEFAIPLPDGKVLPVDSKWTSVDKVEALAASEDPDERKALVKELQRDVEAKVAEVAKYLDPDKTVMMAILAVPDAVYDVCAQAHVRAHQQGVVIVGYSMAVPYVLALLQVIKRFGTRVDEAQVSSVVRTVSGALEAMSSEVEGRFSRAISSLDNSRQAMRVHVGKAQQALGRVQVEVAEGSNGNGHGPRDEEADPEPA